MEFSCRSREPFQLQGQCYACQRAYRRQWNAANPERVDRYQREFRARNPEKMRETWREARERRAADPERLDHLRQLRREAYWRMREDPKRWAEHLETGRMRYRERAAREGRTVRVISKEDYANGNGKAPLKGARRFPAQPVADLISEWIGDLGGVPLGNSNYAYKNSVYGAGFLQLAELSGIPDRTLRAYVTGERTTIQYRTADAICAALDTPLSSLYPEMR